MNKLLFDFNLAHYLPKFNMELGGEPMNGKWAEKIAIQQKLKNNADLRTALEIILLEVARIAKDGGFECQFPMSHLTYTIEEKGKEHDLHRRTIPLSLDDWRFIARCLEKCNLRTEQSIEIDDPVRKEQQNNLFVYW